MLILNFAHPLTAGQREQIEQMSGYPVTEIFEVPCRFDNERPFAPQITEIVDRIPLTAERWQTETLLINPPSYAPATSTLLAELHGRIGYFPSFIRIRPIAGSAVPRFEVAEIIDLQRVRTEARQKR